LRESEYGKLGLGMCNQRVSDFVVKSSSTRAFGNLPKELAVQRRYPPNQQKARIYHQSPVEKLLDAEMIAGAFD